MLDAENGAKRLRPAAPPEAGGESPSESWPRLISTCRASEGSSTKSLQQLAFANPATSTPHLDKRNLWNASECGQGHRDRGGDGIGGGGLQGILLRGR